MELHTIGIDLGKTVFHLVGLNLHGEAVVRKKFSRTRLLRFTANVHVRLPRHLPAIRGNASMELPIHNRTPKESRRRLACPVSKSCAQLTTV